MVATSMLLLPRRIELVFVWAPCSAINLPLKLVSKSLLLWPRLWSPVWAREVHKGKPRAMVHRHTGQGTAVVYMHTHRLHYGFHTK